MMSTRNKWCAAIPLIVFLIHYVLQVFDAVHWPIIHAYLDPLCFFPILFTAWLFEHDWLFGVKRLSGVNVIISTCVLMLLVEEGFPRLSSDFTHDYWDYPAYLIGAGYFWRFINPARDSAGQDV